MANGSLRIAKPVLGKEDWQRISQFLIELLLQIYWAKKKSDKEKAKKSMKNIV